MLLLLLLLCCSHLAPVVGPAAELHLAVLVVEGEPGDVYLAGGLEDAGRYVGAAPRTRQHHIGRVRAVKGFVGTATISHKNKTKYFCIGGGELYVFYCFLRRRRRRKGPNTQ